MTAEVVVSEPSVATQIHMVAREAYAFEAVLIGCADFPPARETLLAIQQSSDRFLVSKQERRIVGVLSYDCHPTYLTITRLAVTPAFHRKGIATQLLAHLEAKTPATVRWTVMTAQANEAALQLYRRFGFTKEHCSVSAEGIPLVHRTRNLKTGSSAESGAGARSYR